MLKEANFNYASDADYHNGRNIITFAIGDFEHYRVEGNTHGRLSHALKHLSEFRKSFVVGLVNEVREDMYKYAKRQLELRGNEIVDNEYDPYFDLNYYFKDSNVQITVDDIKNYKVVYNTAILNYLDLINDDYLMGKLLPPFAQFLKSKYFERIEREYSSVCDAIIKNTVSLDNIQSESQIMTLCDTKDSVCFSVIYNGLPITVILNFKYQALVVIGKNNRFNSAYKLSNGDSHVSHDRVVRMPREDMVWVLLYQKGKRWRYRNPIVREAFRKYANVQ